MEGEGFTLYFAARFESLSNCDLNFIHLTSIHVGPGRKRDHSFHGENHSFFWRVRITLGNFSQEWNVKASPELPGEWKCWYWVRGCWTGHYIFWWQQWDCLLLGVFRNTLVGGGPGQLKHFGCRNLFDPPSLTEKPFWPPPPYQGEKLF